MFNVSNKRAKHVLDSSYLGHSRLGHINKKRMDKLQHDGILQPTHDESLEKCKSCIYGKMARKPFPHQVKRAKDLSGLIHTDVCGPFRTVSREGASYFITFIDDFSRYGYVYLMKHKHKDTQRKRWVTNSTIHSRTRFLLLRMLSSLRIASWYKKLVESWTSRIEYGFYVDVEEYKLWDLNEPPNYKAALSDPEFDKWLEAMNREMQSMKDNQVWVLVDLPPDGRTVRNKWIFKKKSDMDGNRERKKMGRECGLNINKSPKRCPKSEDVFEVLLVLGGIVLVPSCFAILTFESWSCVFMSLPDLFWRSDFVCVDPPCVLCELSRGVLRLLHYLESFKSEDIVGRHTIVTHLSSAVLMMTWKDFHSVIDEYQRGITQNVLANIHDIAVGLIDNNSVEPVDVNSVDNQLVILYAENGPLSAFMSLWIVLLYCVFEGEFVGATVNSPSNAFILQQDVITSQSHLSEPQFSGLVKTFSYTNSFLLQDTSKPILGRGFEDPSLKIFNLGLVRRYLVISRGCSFAEYGCAVDGYYSASLGMISVHRLTHTFKACLIAKGYTQTYDVDYGETFSPVADIRAIRTLLATAAFYDYEICQIDVKTSFLNGHVSEDVYMVQPEGFVDPKHPNKVCKLQRSIYGLKQASRNLGEATYILRIKIIRDRSKRLIALSQNAYLEKILKRFWMENSKKGPDVAFAQNLCSHLQQNPGEIYWTAVKAILKYLRNTKDMVLVYGAKPETKLKKSAKQRNTTMSSIEVEYIAAAEVSMEAVWIRKFIDGLGSVVPSNKRPMEMLCDNEPAIAMANDLRILKGARHFQRKYHYIRKVI
ncbi:retrotransposon protein, putative, ty1-copia subclass [Tanacetum coccineum]